jgi:hypothetical protein
MGPVRKPHRAVSRFRNVLLGITVKPQLDSRLSLSRPFVVPLLPAQQIVIRLC